MRVYTAARWDRILAKAGGANVERHTDFIRDVCQVAVPRNVRRGMIGAMDVMVLKKSTLILVLSKCNIDHRCEASEKSSSSQDTGEHYKDTRKVWGYGRFSH